MQQRIEIASLEKERFVELFDEWRREVAVKAIPLGYDEWMDQRFARGSEATASFRQRSVSFELSHGGHYEVRGADRKRRVFRCQLSGHLPYISFVNLERGIFYPWISFPSVFTQAELVSLKRLG
ncbi:hypothetical protein [Cupriavidus numazuensis]|uniref:Uncharacterized protein n=1 Tax=Cupriavidus numazuensis TaxID=221992 RepID=A0ABM8TTT9_9BURK|nr:hypothetical protein [Cupriavidus numazuensis]CAG2159761.1 hypothetical protein LMG26411_06957 [Cupriavidus numazuensis]